MRKLLALLGLLVVASLVLSACGGAAATQAPAQPGEPQVVVVTATPGPEEPAPAKPAVLRHNLGTYPDTIDP